MLSLNNYIKILFCSI